MDAHFRTLDSLRRADTESAPSIAQLLFEWKARFSLKWYRHYYEKPHIPLTDVWLLLFDFVEFHDTNVNIAAFNCIGAFLISLSPFCTPLLRETFGAVIGQLPVSPNTSIAVISTFIFLSHEIAPHEMASFIDGTPVLHHFGADLRMFIHHVPAMIPRMSELRQLDFHKALLRSLISSFARQPNAHFVNAVLAMLDRFPTRLLSDLMEFVEANELNATLLACGGRLLKNPELAQLLSHQQKMKLFELAKDHLGESATAGEMEQAVAVMSAFKTASDDDIRDLAVKFAQEIDFGAIPTHVRRLLTPLVSNFDDLRSPEDAAAADICVRVAAMGNFSPERDADILAICTPYLSRRDNVFIAVVELFIARPSILRTRPRVMQTILTAQDLSWVHQNAVVTLIGVLDQFEFRAHIPRYSKMAMNAVLSAALSRQTVLAQTGRTALAAIIGLHNSEALVSRLLKVDWFDAHTVEAVIAVLNVVTDKKNSIAFRPLIRVLIDAMLEFPDQPFVPAGFTFLRHFPTVRVHSRLLELCVLRLQQLYWSFTQKKLQQTERTHSIDFSALGPRLSQITTDVVSSDSLAVDAHLDSLRACFAYLVANQTFNCAWLVPAMLPLAPEDAMQAIMRRGISVSSTVVEPLFSRAQPPEVLVECAAFFARAPSEIAHTVFAEIRRLRLVSSAQLAFAIVEYLAARDPDSALEGAREFLRGLPEAEEHGLAVKLSRIKLGLHEELVAKYPFLGIEEHPDQTSVWFRTTPLGKWPLKWSREYAVEVLRFLAKSKERIVIPDIQDLGLEEWKMIMSHPDVFDRQQLKDFFVDSRNWDKLKRIWRCAKTKVFRGVKPVSNVCLEPTAAPFLRQGVILDSPVLLKSFFLNSRVTIPQNLFDEICAKYPTLEKEAERYAQAHGLKVPPRPSGVDIQALMANFSMKAKALCALCKTATNGPEIEILRMLIFQQLSALTSDKRWFYCLRFLRLTMTVDDSKVEVYRRNTAEWMKDIFSVFTPQSDAAMNELCQLLKSVFPLDVLRQRAEQYVRLAPTLFRSFQEGDYFTEVPSLILEVVHYPAQYGKHDVTKLIEERRGLVLSNFLLAHGVIDFLAQNPTYLSKPDGYVSALLDSASPLFPIGEKLVTQVLPRCSASLRSYETAIALLRINGYSLPSAIPVSSAYYRAMMKASAGSDAPHRFEVQELNQLTELFLLSPSISNWRPFADVLSDVSEFFDSMRLLFERLVGIGHGFLFVLLIAKAHLAVAPALERARFIEMVRKTAGIHPTSRRLALLRLSEKKIDAAFWFAAAESNDEGALAPLDTKKYAGS
jgi:hypothetical protein